MHDADIPSRSATFIDYYGRPVTVKANVNRVVSLAPGITETILALGHGSKLIGRTDFDDFSPEIQNVPSVGNMTQPAMEIILALSPDIVIASNHCPRSVVESLEQVNIDVAVLMAGTSFTSVYSGVIKPIAAILGDADSGDSLVREMELIRSTALEKADSFPYRPKVYYVVGFGEGGDWTAGGNTFIGDMIQAAGGDNIAQSVSGWSFSLEALVNADPDVIIISSTEVEKFSRTPIYSGLRAVNEDRLIGIDEDIVVRQGPRLAEGFSSLVNAIGTVF